MSVFPDALGRSYTLQNPVSDQEITINLRVQISESKGATSQVSFYRTPGVDAFVTVPTPGFSAMFAINGRSWGLSGGTFYEFTHPADVATATARGTVLVGTDPGTISANGQGGDQLLVTSGSSVAAGIAGNAYVYDLTANTLTLIATLTGKATQGDMLNGYGLVFDQTTATVYYSDLLDFSVFDPANFFQRSNQADDYQALRVSAWGYLCLPGSQTGEFWYPNGGFPLPFQPDPAGNFNNGIAATFSITNVGGSLCWLSTTHDGGLSVVSASGLQPRVISDRALEQELSTYTRVEDCIGDSFQYKGQTFLRLTFPSQGVTKQYDLTSGVWTDVGTWISEANAYTYFRPVFHAYAFGVHLFGDRETGTLYELSDDFATDVDGRDLRWLRRTPSVVTDQDYVFHQKLAILMQTGVGNALPPGEAPAVMLRYSDDGGRTWGTEVQAAIGAIGAYGTLVWFWSLGVARNRVYELSGTDPVVTALTQISLTVEKAA